MTYKTHAAIGIGTSSFLIPTNDVKTILAGITLAIAGSLIVDVDTPSSKAAVFIKNIICFSAIIILINVFLLQTYNINLINYITQNQELQRLAPGIISLIMLIIIGLNSKHRYFTHSIPIFLAFTTAVYFIVGQFYIWFSVGYIMHILVDLLNEKPVNLFYPLKKGFCLGICKSSGIVDNTLFIVFSIITVMRYDHFIGFLTIAYR
ncbi:metal-dependent hydrolase [uncultured Clostridium sp.]|uniref:metal-dependent hydrolase n=1 Tax=uncultured Clostridium sp. TaxID=59620 RepID=UPI0028E3B24F|nr:metal-dependent hydrolase [uncultured Clostridium sp.]